MENEQLIFSALFYHGDEECGDDTTIWIASTIFLFLGPIAFTEIIAHILLHL